MDETDHGLTPRIQTFKVNRKPNEINDLPTPPPRQCWVCQPSLIALKKRGPRLNLNVAANAGTPRATNITVAGTSVLVEQEGTPLSCSLDFDGDAQFTPAIDGVLLLRYSLGVRGDSLTQGLSFAPSATRKTASAITSYIETPGRSFDIDGDGALTQTDALLAMRALQGLSGSALTVNALSTTRTRSPAQIQTILAQCLR